MSKYFEIDSDNNISVFRKPDEVETEYFTSQAGLSKLTLQWPLSRLTDIWNSFAGVSPFSDLAPVKKFENKTKAVERIWRAIQKLEPAPERDPQPFAPKVSKAALKARATAVNVPRNGSKAALAIAMMERSGGATQDELMVGFGWQRHTVRGFIATLESKRGLKVQSFKNHSGERVYRIAP